MHALSPGITAAMSIASIQLVKTRTDDFSDLEGDLDAVPVTAEPVRDFLQDSVDMARRSAATGIPCPRCRGKGHAFGGVCFRCNGAKIIPGPKMDATNVARRASEANKRAQAERDLSDRIAQFSVDHADVMGYCGRIQNEFTANCLRQLKNEGTMSPGRLAAIYKSLDRVAEAAAARVAAAPNVAGAGFAKLLEGFKHAAETGLKQPKMKCGELVFKLATAVSKNPGFVYVCRDTEYKGKIAPDGKFFAARETTAQETAEIERIGRDPFAAAVEHGRLTGQCSICSRKLTDPVSVAAGIGPICAKGMGW